MSNTCAVVSAVVAGIALSACSSPGGGSSAMSSSAADGTMPAVRAATGSVTATPTGLNFMAIVGRPSPPQNVTLANGTGQTITISGISAVGGYMHQTNNCGSRLSAGKSCTIAVVFDPTAGGCYDHHCKGKLSVTESSPPDGQAVTLTGDIL